MLFNYFGVLKRIVVASIQLMHLHFGDFTGRRNEQKKNQLTRKLGMLAGAGMFENHCLPDLCAVKVIVKLNC